MSAGTGQNRLLPYLLVILLILLGYVAYTRLATPRQPGPVTPAGSDLVPPGGRHPAPTPRPTPVAAPRPVAVAIPARPLGRPNPFSPLVSEAGLAGPGPSRAAPLPPPVPPPFFPEPSGRRRPGEEETGFRATGAVLMQGVRVAVLRLGERTYFARPGDVVEGFRVVEVRSDAVRIRSSAGEHVFALREVGPP